MTNDPNIVTDAQDEELEQALEVAGNEIPDSEENEEEEVFGV